MITLMVDWVQVRRRLVERREAAGLTGKEAAALAGVSNSYVSNLENGYATPGAVEFIASLARAYGTSIDYLLGLTEDSRPPTGSDALEPSMESAWRALQTLSPARRNELLLIADALARADLADQERIARNIEVNRWLLDTVQKVGGDEALDALLTLLGEPAGLDRARLLTLLDPKQPDKEQDS